MDSWLFPPLCRSFFDRQGICTWRARAGIVFGYLSLSFFRFFGRLVELSVSASPAWYATAVSTGAPVSRSSGFAVSVRVSGRFSGRATTWHRCMGSGLISERVGREVGSPWRGLFPRFPRSPSVLPRLSRSAGALSSRFSRGFAGLAYRLGRMDQIFGCGCASWSVRVVA